MSKKAQINCLSVSTVLKILARQKIAIRLDTSEDVIKRMARKYCRKHKLSPQETML